VPCSLHLFLDASWPEVGSCKGTFAQCAFVNLSGIALLCFPGTWIAINDLKLILQWASWCWERWYLRAYKHSSSCFLRTLDVDSIGGFLACEYNNVSTPLPFPIIQTSNSFTFTPTYPPLLQRCVIRYPCTTITTHNAPLGNYFCEPFFAVIDHFSQTVRS
jgi:hypothetical protein